MTNNYLADRLPETLPADPMHWAAAWLASATNNNIQRNPNSMTLVSVGPNAAPSARIVLCKAFEADPGYVVMYTNYESQKCLEIEQNSNVYVLFHWDSMGRQIRIGGTAIRSPATESDAYFASRDGGSQLGAWGSDQSRAIESHAALVRQIRDRAAEQGVALADAHGTRVAEDAAAISRPPYWGGMRIWASSIELWIEGKDRIHDRALWTRKLTPNTAEGFDFSAWTGTRLQP
ncbi:MAG: pyridoxamine 5'-phosphate oxidase [Gammaproteobacteria bacterium]|nr:pyridoxamine 5'-phosphate oxidase [Gammaproteobacteria bacterium]